MYFRLIKKHLAFRIALGFAAIGGISVAVGTIGYLGVTKLNTAISATSSSVSAFVSTNEAGQAFRAYVEDESPERKAAAHDKISTLKSKISAINSTMAASIAEDIENIASQIDILGSTNEAKRAALSDIDLSVQLLGNSAEELLKKAELASGMSDAGQKKAIAEIKKIGTAVGSINDVQQRLTALGGFVRDASGSSKGQDSGQLIADLSNGLAALEGNLKLVTNKDMKAKLALESGSLGATFDDIKSALTESPDVTIPQPAQGEAGAPIAARFDAPFFRMLSSFGAIRTILDQGVGGATGNLEKGIQSAQKSKIAVTRVRVFSKTVSQASGAIKDFQINPAPETQSLVQNMLAAMAKDGDTLKDVGMPSPARQISSTKEAFGKLVTEIGNASRIRRESDILVSNVVKKISMITDAVVSSSRNTSTMMINTMLVSIVTALLATILISVLVGRSLTKPITVLTGTMRRLAEGDTQALPVYADRADEIGDMARALGIFRENAIEKLRIQAQSEENDAATEAERSRNDSERRANAEQLNFAVSALASGLERLSHGNLAEGIDTPFGGSLERLRTDFNTSLLRLCETLAHIKQNALAIQVNGVAMRGSAEDLSKRTESQAVSLEETAAAVEEITTTVRSTALRAVEALGIMTKTKKGTEVSASVVGDTISAMARIEDAAQKIEQIIDVIEEIAFQTNLLALNAGIEAARAGDAGKGFAVVAMEVRELAQRSAGAAREIKELIETSAREVSSGVLHVRETGRVIGEISSQISALSDHVQMIAQAAEDQSTGLQEVNGTVNRMDQMTQANAAMAEETNALSQQLSSEADELMHLVIKFNVQTQDERTDVGIDHSNSLHNEPEIRQAFSNPQSRSRQR